MSRIHKTENTKKQFSYPDYWGMLQLLLNRKEKRQYVYLLLMISTGAALEFIGIGLIPGFVALLSTPEKLEAVPFIGNSINSWSKSKPMQVFWAGGTILIFVFFLKTIFFIGLYRYQYGLIARQRTHISQKLFCSYMTAPWSFHLQQNSSDLMRKVMSETSELVTGVIQPILSVLLGGMMSILFLLLMSICLPIECVAAFLGLAICAGFLMNWFKTHLANVGNKSKHEARRALRAVNEGIDTIIEAKVLGKESFLIQRFVYHMTNFSEADRLRLQSSACFPHLLETVVVLGLVMVLSFLLYENQSFKSVIPQLVLIGALAMRLRQTFAMVFTGISQINFSKIILIQITHDLEELKESRKAFLHNSTISIKPMPFEKELRFQNVTFHYPNTKQPAIYNLDLTITKGESAAFVGSTGSGKSTAINLLLGLLIPTNGTITVDGQPIHRHPNRWQRHIGYVPQTIHLLDDTIRRNIAFGVAEEQIDDNQISRVIHMAQLQDTVLKLEDGINTFVGERGVRLSGGQRQRIGIARALYHNPLVLIMDEATSALDSATEASLVKCLRSLEGAITMIFVAHRLSTIEHCNRICFFNEGKLEASGSHTELIKKVPSYCEMQQLGMD